MTRASLLSWRPPTDAPKPSPVQFVVQAENTVSQLLSDPSVAQLFAQYSSEFAEEVDRALEGTLYKAEVEFAYERLNGLVQSDATFALLRDAQFLAILLLNDLQLRIHNAVALCVAAFGSNCDPGNDAQVRALLPSANLDSLSLMSTAGQFYEIYNRFQYEFSQSPVFINLQNESVARVEAQLTPVRSEIETARQSFDQKVNSIPQVATALDVLASLGARLRSRFPELDTRIRRVETLLLKLANQTVPLEGTSTPASSAAR